MSKEKLATSAPGKLMLFGEHAVIYDRPSIVTAVDHRLKVSIVRSDSDYIVVNAPEVGIKNYRKNLSSLAEVQDIPKGVRFIEQAILSFNAKHPIEGGIKVETESEFSSKFGFGSSSAVTVGMIKGLSEMYGANLSEKEIFDLSYETLLEVQGVGSGFDLAAAIWGGVVYFVTSGKEIEPVEANSLPLVVGYTGIKADTSSLVRNVAKLYQKDRLGTEEIFEEITDITFQARDALKRSDFVSLGFLMDRNQGLLERLGVSSKELSNLISAARNAGAYGAKLSGAGGGDCMIAFVNEDMRGSVERAISSVGGTIINVKTNAEGVRIEK